MRGVVTEQSRIAVTRVSIQCVDCYSWFLIASSGLRAAELTNDSTMYPIRGHVLRVRAPWVRQYINRDGYTYIIPNTDTVVLGGTTQKGDWALKPTDEDRRQILERCYEVLPSLRKAPIVKEWVGLRPGRPAVRLERDSIKVDGKHVPVVHNYGHGGSGLTLGWGCATDVVALVQQALAVHSSS